MPKRFQFDDYYPGAIQEIMKEQKELTMLAEKNPELGLDPRVFIVIDDCTDDQTRYDNILHRLYYTGRHYNIWLFQVSWA